MSGEEQAAIRRSLGAIDRLLAVSPPCSAEEAMAAVRCGVALRDLLIARLREHGATAETRARLDLANAVLGLTWSGVVPVSGFRRGRLEKARAALAAAAGEPGGVAAEEAPA